MQRENNLQWFLIKKFIWILVIVGLAEYGITILLNRVIVPVVILRFFPEYRSLSTIGNTGRIVIILAMLLLLVLRGLQNILPSGVRDIVRMLGEQIEKGASYLSPQQSEIFRTGPDGMDSVILFLILLVIIFLILLPYAIGALVFARITIREFSQIQQEKEAAKKEFDKRRNLMLSDIAHDLRTPMTTVAGYAKALADGMVTEPERQQEYLGAMQNKAARMNDLINLLFEYVKLDSDGFALDKKAVDLCELLRENAALVYSDVESAAMELEVDIPEEQITVEADPIQLSRVVTNLLTNAIRHNAEGTRIGLFVLQEPEQTYVLVADSGSLIPEEQSEHLFEPFARGDESRKSGGGSGLGLSIAKKVVEMHGWRLSLVQQPGIQHYRGAERYAKAFVIKL